MIVEFHGTYINLRGETEEERKILKEMYDYGIMAWGGGSYLSFSANEEGDNPQEKLEAVEKWLGDLKKTTPLYYIPDVGIKKLDKILDSQFIEKGEDE